VIAEKLPHRILLQNIGDEISSKLGIAETLVIGRKKILIGHIQLANRT